MARTTNTKPAAPVTTVNVSDLLATIESLQATVAAMAADTKPAPTKPATTGTKRGTKPAASTKPAPTTGKLPATDTAAKAFGKGKGASWTMTAEASAVRAKRGKGERITKGERGIRSRDNIAANAAMGAAARSGDYDGARGIARAYGWTDAIARLDKWEQEARENGENA